jgi:hypothetical protein
VGGFSDVVRYISKCFDKINHIAFRHVIIGKIDFVLIGKFQFLLSDFFSTSSFPVLFLGSAFFTGSFFEGFSELNVTSSGSISSGV